MIRNVRIINGPAQGQLLDLDEQQSYFFSRAADGSVWHYEIYGDLAMVHRQVYTVEVKNA